MESALEDLSEAELLDLAISSRLIDLHTSFPAKVEAYDASKQTVDVVPHLNRSLPDGAGNFVTEELPKLSDVPVVFPRCGKYAITFPLTAGDYVLVVCCQRNLGIWRATGNQGDAGDLGTHTLDGAVAIAGLFPDSAASPNAHGTNMVVGREDQGNARLEFTPTGVNLGAGATKGVARSGDDLTASADFATWASQVEAGITGGGGVAPSPVFASRTAGTAGGLGAIHGASANIKAVD